MKKYVIWATSNHGDGFSEQIGQYDSFDDIKIRVGFYAKDVIITIEEAWLEEAAKLTHENTPVVDGVQSDEIGTAKTKGV